MGAKTEGVSKFAEKIGEAFDRNFTNKEELAKAGIDLEKVKAEIIKDGDAHIEAMARIQFDHFAKEIEDAASAREREVQIATSDKSPLINKVVQPILAIIIVVATLTIWALILFRNYEPKINEAMIVGALTTLAANVLQYYFGSSSSSKQKQDMLERKMK